jgi:hypothetical protein
VVDPKRSGLVYLTEGSLRDVDEFRLGFLESSNPRKFRAMLQMATLNAARTMVKPVKAKAPVRTGRLRGAVAARKAKFNNPAAVVGIKAGATRGDSKGAWYRWFVVSGHRTRGTGRAPERITWAQAAAGAALPQRRSGFVPARNFVYDATSDSGVRARAEEVLAKTVRAWLDGAIKYKARKAK